MNAVYAVDVKGGTMCLRLKILPVCLTICLAMSVMPAIGLTAGTNTSPQAQKVEAEPEAIGLQESFVKIASEVKPAVVNISAVFEENYSAPQYEFFFGSPFEDFFDEFFGGQSPQGRRQPRTRQFQRRYEGMGSGVIIDPDGYVLTNEHVVQNAKQIKVTTSDDKKYEGKVVGKDARTDIAVIKIKGSKFPYVKLGDSEKIRVGEWAMAIGSPFGLEETVTVGIISAVRQSLPIEGRAYKDLIQTDAAINRGNSGGPLCNIRGEVIGINTAIYAPTGVFSGIGFAIPINSAREILSDLIQKGRVVRGWLGVDIRPVDAAITHQFGLDNTKGALINNVMENSPAAKAGLERGDILIAYNGTPIDDVRTLQTMVSQTQPKSRIPVKVIREGKTISKEITTGEMPQEEASGEQKMEQRGQGRSDQGRSDGQQAPAKKDFAEWQGAQVVTLDPSLARRLEVSSGEKGCIVADVQEGSVMVEVGLIPGDVIRYVNKVPTPTTKEFRAVTKNIDVAHGFVLDVNRQGRLLYLSYTGK